MSRKILQINYKFNVSRAEHDQVVSAVASEIAAVPGLPAVPGLHWKVWLMNEADSEAGGIYLFEDEASTNAYLEGPIVAQLVKLPALSDINVKQFDVPEKLTEITRGPVG